MIAIEEAVAVAEVGELMAVGAFEGLTEPSTDGHLISAPS